MKEHITANGREQLLAAPEVQQQIAEIRRAVETQCAARLATAGWARRWWLRIEMRREIARRIEQIAPSDGLYLH